MSVLEQVSQLNSNQRGGGRRAQQPKLLSSPPRPLHLRCVLLPAASFIYPFRKGHTCAVSLPAKPPLTSHLPPRSVLEIETSIKTERWYHFQGHRQEGRRREEMKRQHSGKTKIAQSTEMEGITGDVSK